MKSILTKNKKGVSDVITTVLMILLVIAAIVIIWGVISNFLSTGTQNVTQATDCMTTVLTIKSAVYNPTDYTMRFQVERTGSTSTSMDYLQLYCGGTSYPRIGDTSKLPEEWLNNHSLPGTGYAWPNLGETRTYKLNMSSPSETACITGNNLEVVAVFNGKVCSTKSEPYKISN